MGLETTSFEKIRKKGFGMPFKALSQKNVFFWLKITFYEVDTFIRALHCLILFISIQWD
jgi:hypothetical protein